MGHSVFAGLHHVQLAIPEVHRFAGRRSRVVIGVDGSAAAGKSMFSARLVDSVMPRVVRASLDDFQRPREDRYRRGHLSLEGYYFDAFDYAAAQALLIQPFLLGAEVVHTAVFDYWSNAAIEDAIAHVPRRVVLIVDGVFLHRAELRPAWTLSLYLHDTSHRITPTSTGAARH